VTDITQRRFWLNVNGQNLDERANRTGSSATATIAAALAPMSASAGGYTRHNGYGSRRGRIGCQSDSAGERSMIEQTSDPIPQDLCDAFSSAVREYAEWTQLIAPEPQVSFESGQCPISEICDNVMMWPKAKEQELPSSVLKVMHDSAHDRALKETIGRSPTYDVCASCLLELINGRKALGREIKELNAAITEWLHSPTSR
jgi:hypothetical protein